MNRRAGLLLEAVVALAILVASGLVILSVMRDASTRVHRLHLDRKAIDLAASAAALIEAGASTPERLNGSVPDWSSGWLSGSAGQTGRSDFQDDLPTPTGWRLRAVASQGPNDSVRRVEITAEYTPDRPSGASRLGDDAPAASATTTRLVRRESTDAETTVGELDNIEIEAMRGANVGGGSGGGRGDNSTRSTGGARRP